MIGTLSACFTREVFGRTVLAPSSTHLDDLLTRRFSAGSLLETHFQHALHLDAHRACVFQSGDGIELFDLGSLEALQRAEDGTLDFGDFSVRVLGAGRVPLQFCNRVFLPEGRNQRRVPEQFLRNLFLFLFLHLHCLAVAGEALSRLCASN